MRILAFISGFLLMFFSYAQEIDILEYITNQDTIKVFFTKEALTYLPGAQAGMQCPEIEEKDTIPNDFEQLYPLLINELNKTFETNKFRLFILDSVPKKEVVIMDEEVKVPDWNAMEGNLIAMCTLSVLYEGQNKADAISGETMVLHVLRLFWNTRFHLIDKGELNTINPLGVSIKADSDLFQTEKCPTSLEELQNSLAPNSMVDAFGKQIPGTFDRFYKRQLKKSGK